MITLSMIVKNEEKFLRGCLESVSDVVDEIIIVDTGSTDNTINIAREFSAKVYEFTWNDSFSDARNFALSKSTGKYILYLDADERLTNDSKNELKELAQNDERKGYYCRISNIDEVNKKPSVMKYVRFFPNDNSVRFEGRIHEQIEHSLLRNQISLADSKIKIEHLGYNLSEENKQEKATRNLLLLLKDFSENPSSYNAFQIAQTYAVLNDRTKSESYFKLALNDKKLKPEYLSLAYRYLAVNAAERNNLNEAVSFCDKSLEADPNQPISILVSANLNFQNKQFEKAFKLYNEAYQLNREFLLGKRDSFQTIYLDNRLILLEAMHAFLIANQKNLFEKFLGYLKNENDEISVNDYQIINYLYQITSCSDLPKYIDLVNKENLTIVMILLKNIDMDLASEIYSKLYENFPDNTAFIKQYAEFNILTGNTKYAEILLNRCYHQSSDPSMIFYLVSFYVKNNMPEKIKPVLETAGKRFKDDEIVSKQLLILQNKLKAFISN